MHFNFFGVFANFAVKKVNKIVHIIISFWMPLDTIKRITFKLINDTRDEVTQKLITRGNEMGADAIIGIRYQNSDIAPGTSEILVYGTAVRFEDPK